MRLKQYLIEYRPAATAGAGDADRSFRPDTSKKCKCGKHFAPSKRYPEQCARCTRDQKKGKK